jgi:hypothetical protein
MNYAEMALLQSNASCEFRRTPWRTDIQQLVTLPFMKLEGSFPC